MHQHRLVESDPLIQSHRWRLQPTPCSLHPEVTVGGVLDGWHVPLACFVHLVLCAASLCCFTPGCVWIVCCLSMEGGHNMCRMGRRQFLQDLPETWAGDDSSRPGSVVSTGRPERRGSAPRLNPMPPTMPGTPSSGRVRWKFALVVAPFRTGVFGVFGWRVGLVACATWATSRPVPSLLPQVPDCGGYCQVALVLVKSVLASS
jgi:hypothetical protein